MSDKKNTDEEKPKKAGMDSFFSSIKQGFENFQTSLEDMAQKNKENWEGNKDKVNQFFKDVKQNWDNQFKKWGDDLEQAKKESDEEWLAQTKKVETDIKNWQSQVRKDWNQGVKEFNRASAMAYVRFLLYAIPIIILIIVILRLIVPYIPM